MKALAQISSPFIPGCLEILWRGGIGKPEREREESQREREREREVWVKKVADLDALLEKVQTPNVLFMVC